QVNGDIPPRLKKSAHEVILEFIRSRPPLNPARCRPGNSSRRRSLLPCCTNASWKKSKLRGSWGPCRRARCAGQSWVRTHTHTHSQPSDSSMLLPRSYTRTNNPHVHTSHTHTPCKSCI
ncbi:unnamed protein product, partial [Tetraodon nigroviridis]